MSHGSEHVDNIAAAYAGRVMGMGDLYPPSTTWAWLEFLTKLQASPARMPRFEMRQEMAPAGYRQMRLNDVVVRAVWPGDGWWIVVVLASIVAPSPSEELLAIAGTLLAHGLVEVVAQGG